MIYRMENVMIDKLFSHGAQWIKGDFHLHTRVDKEFIYNSEDNSYISNYTQALVDSGIQLGVVTNHNKFNSEEFKLLRKKATKSEVGLLPGIELSVKDGQAGIHTLVIFSEDWIVNKENKNWIQSFLNVTFSGQANFENENGRSNHDILDTIRELDKFHKDYFLIFAHVEAPNGLWGGLSIGRIQELFKNETFNNRVLGFQKVRTRNTKSKFTQMLGNRYPAELEGSDAKSIQQIGSRKESSFIKLGAWSYDAVKFALQNHEHRVELKLPTCEHSHLKSISFEGAGALGGTTINFSSGLNTLIGIRGSGKSSILEAIRYALNIPFGDKASDTDYKEGLVRYLLGSGGKITIDAVDRRRQPYQIRRIFGERSDVYVNGQIQPGVSIRETVFHKPIYFGQKDLSSTGSGFEKDLIEKLVGEALMPIRLKIDEQKKVVVSAIEQKKRLKRDAEQKKEWLQKKNDALFRLKFYKEHGVEDKLQKQIDFDRDERKAAQVIQHSENYLYELNSFSATFEDELKNQLVYNSNQNKYFFDDFFITYQQIITNFEELKSLSLKTPLIIKELKNKLEQFQHKKQTLKESFAEIERKLAGELQQAGALAISPQEFRKLKALLDQADQMLKVASQSEIQKIKIDDILKVELVKLNDLWHEEFSKIVIILEKINREDSPLKIVPKFKSNKKEMLIFMQNLFRGSRIREITLQGLVDAYSDFGAMWRDWPEVLLQVNSSHEMFVQYFRQNIDSLLTWQVPNEFTIEYHGKSLQHHSLGQRASALMLFVLSQEDNDVVVIDQPEDDLDNQTIYDDVIKLIGELKPKTQFIFATHNANIPVLGDAEQVVCCNYQDDKVAIQSGSIDCPNIQSQIVKIMEGGAEAFEKRKQVYEAWKPKNF
jgi:chromosome segregation protein